MKRQTAANNPILARVKKIMNAKIYAKVCRLINDGDIEGAKTYLGQFFNDASRAESIASFFATER